MNALVTGAAGLIGAHLVRALLARGWQVRALVRETSRREPLAGLPVEFVVGDVLNEADLDTACADRDAVFHAAAHFAYSGVDTATLHATAVTGTENMLAACARMGVPRVVVTSSSVVFGHCDAPGCIDESAGLASGDGEPPYVAAKIAQHRHALELGATLKLDVRLACPTMTLGPTSGRLGPSNGLIVAYLADPFGCTFPGGVNLAAARDVAIGHALIAEHGAPGESYLFGSENLTWQQIHAAIAELTGVAPPRLVLNQTLTYLAATAEELRAAIGDRTPLSTREQAAMVGRYYWYSHAKAATIGYAPISARAALIETIAWLAASAHVTREVRAGMHLAADIYRFRAAAARGEPA
ncbi:MAG TPA: NAD-dependent epimerase/dehydratase family protein [Acetobacteraceae bacterium]|jgi:dihydroflavonol-4-reductase|nr:NAD-dependent epimerase/dehydratase family protein [Acetobacteraceae bacterium]